MTTAENIRELTRADRCDRCRARAKALAILPEGGELMFCQHHFDEHGSKLCDLGATIITRRKYEDDDGP